MESAVFFWLGVGALGVVVWLLCCGGTGVRVMKGRGRGELEKEFEG